ncbi:MAG TPA: STAS domain-containing protein [Candidatus Baltobacteraceae bacterium]|nr:STAS domain-containing protein [Candidatus Baltobacteraceae bacterium]
MMGEQLSIDITTENHGETVIYRLRGCLDLATSPSVRAALVEAAGGDKHDIIVDLTKLEYLDSTGLGALIGGHRRAIEKGGAIRLAVGNGAIARLLTITGLIRVFPVYATLEDAVADRSRLTATV